MVMLLANGLYGGLGGVDAAGFTSSIARLSSGGFVVLRGSLDASISATIYDAAGQQRGSPVPITADGSAPDVVGLANGGFAIAWADGSNPAARIKAQLFDANGIAIAAPAILGQPGTGYLANARVTGLADGGIAVEWLRLDENSSIARPVLRLVDSSGTALTTPLVTDDSGHVSQHDLLTLPNGHVLIGTSGDGAAPGIVMRDYDPGTQTLSAPLITIAARGGFQFAALASGDIAIAWSGTSDSTAGVHAQIFTAAGVAVSPAVSVADFAFTLTLAALDRGGFAVGYSNSGLMMQVYDNGGVAVGGPSLLTNWAGSTAAITAFGTDDIAVAYTQSTTDADGTVSNRAPIDFYRSVTSGTGGADMIDGTAERDILRGLDGADTLNGGDASDVLIGGAGADVLNGGGGSDYADYSDSAVGVVVNLATGAAHGGTAEGDTFFSIESLIGSNFADTLTGDANANYLNGGDGDDLLVGGAGADVLIGGNGTDTADYSASPGAVTVILTLGAGSGGDAQGDTLQVENVRGSEYGDILIGHFGANRLEGLGGDDVLIGTGESADILDGGAGNDTVSYETSASGVWASLGSGTGYLGDAQGDRFISIENLRGSANDDILIGDAAANRLEGLAGADTLTGGGGADILTGGAGNDSFRDTAAGLNGDTITDFGADDRIVITDATLARFNFSLTGATLTYTGGTLTLANLPANMTLRAAADSAGGVDLTLVAAVAHKAAHDFNGDGRSDILWRNDNGQMSNWLGTATGGFVGNDGNAFASVPTDWHIADVGDFNGDGRADILWRNDNGLLSDWLGTASGGFVGNDAIALTRVSTAWHVVGTGDFNGDGRSDILWRNDNGQLSDWLGQTNGGLAGNDANAFTSAPTDWHVVGTGDFNGDGRTDILWRDDAGHISDWLANAGGGFASNDTFAFGAVPASWHVAATGDFNGDGRSDILWRNDNGQLSDWLGKADGGFATNDAAAFGTVPTSWHIAGTGDFNGDGRDDILWRNYNGQLSDWLGTASGGFVNNDAAASGSAPAAWHTQIHNDFIL